MGVRLKNTQLEYFAVPKIACTSIKLAIFAHNEPDVLVTMRPPHMRDPNFVIFHHEGRAYHNIHQFYPPQPLRFRPWPKAEGKLRFCVVRDPIRRFLSGYGNRIVFHNDLKLPEPPTLGEFVDRFEEYLHIPVIRGHFSPMIRYIGIRPGFFDRIFDISQLGEVTTYCEQHGVAIELPHAQSEGPKIALSELTPAMRDKLVRFYRHDYRIFGKFFQSSI